MSIDVGAAGEAWVELIATLAQITVSRTTRDKEGWDHCLQWTPENNARREPLDRSPPQVTCFVQVKTTMADTTSEKVSLANWARMAKSPVPYFFIRVVLDNAGEATGAFLVHVGNDLIAATLKRLVDLGEDATEADLAGKTMQLTWDETQRLNKPFHAELKQKILSHIGDMHSYTMRKAEIVRTAGYDASRYSLVFKTRSDDADLAFADELANLSVGLVKEVPISVLEVSERRFGRKRLLPDRSGEATITIPQLPSLGITKVTLEDSKLRVRVSLPCETYTSDALLPKLAKRHHRTRFVCPIAEVLIVGWKTATFSWNYPSGEAPLNFFASAATLVQLAARGRKVSLLLSREGKRFSIGGVVLQSAVSLLSLQEANVFLAAKTVAEHFGVEPELPVDPNAVLDSESTLTMLAALILFRPTKKKTIVHVKVRVPMEKPPTKGKSAICVVPGWVTLGDSVLAATAKISGTMLDVRPIGEGIEIVIEPTEAELLDEQHSSVSEFVSDGLMEKARELYDEALKHETVDFVLFKPPEGETWLALEGSMPPPASTTEEPPPSP